MAGWLFRGFRWERVREIHVDNNSTMAAMKYVYLIYGLGKWTPIRADADFISAGEHRPTNRELSQNQARTSKILLQHTTSAFA